MNVIDLNIDTRILWRKVSESDYIVNESIVLEFSPSKEYVKIGSEWIKSSNVIILEIF